VAANSDWTLYFTSPLTRRRDLACCQLPASLENGEKVVCEQAVVRPSDGQNNFASKE